MSEIFVDTIKNKAGSTSLDSDKLPNMLSGSAKVWVNFNGTGTIATRDSFNVSSLTDHATGQYQVNISSSMSNSNYAVTGSHSEDNNTSPTGLRNSARQYNNLTTSSYRLQPCQSASSFADVQYHYNLAQGDLA